MSLSQPSGAPARAPLSLSITGDPVEDGLILKVLAIAASALATWLGSKLGNNDPNFTADLIYTLTGVLAMVLTVVVGVVNSRFHRQQAVTAGMNLALTNNAIMQGTGNGTVMPVPVTAATAKEIVNDFAKTPAELEPHITDALNAAQVPAK